MNWTSEKPTKAGWYWWRFSKDAPRSQWEVRLINDYQIGSQILLGQWAGPLEEPPP